MVSENERDADNTDVNANGKFVKKLRLLPEHRDSLSSCYHPAPLEQHERFRGGNHLGKSISNCYFAKYKYVLELRFKPTNHVEEYP